MAEIMAITALAVSCAALALAVPGAARAWRARRERLDAERARAERRAAIARIEAEGGRHLHSIGHAPWKVSKAPAMKPRPAADVSDLTSCATAGSDHSEARA